MAVQHMVIYKYIQYLGIHGHLEWHYQLLFIIAVVQVINYLVQSRILILVFPNLIGVARLEKRHPFSQAWKIGQK